MPARGGSGTQGHLGRRRGSCRRRSHGETGSSVSPLCDIGGEQQRVKRWLALWFDLLTDGVDEGVLQDVEVEVDDLRVAIGLLQAHRVEGDGEAWDRVGEEATEDLLCLATLAG